MVNQKLGLLSEKTGTVRTSRWKNISKMRVPAHNLSERLREWGGGVFKKKKKRACTAPVADFKTVLLSTCESSESLL